MNSLQEINKRINELISNMSSSKLSEEELMELEQLAQKLYERSIILNYKAKEEKVYQKEGKHKADDVKEEIPVSQEEIVVKEETKNETPQENTGEIQFDFSGDMAFTTEEPKTETIDEKIEEKIAPMAKSINSSELNDTEKGFLKQFTLTYQEVAKDKINNAKLSSLKSAFGLNDRMLFIRELFNGNSDLFNQTMEELDQFTEHESAFSVISKIAVQHNWDKEADSTNEFIHIISRKYVG
ncbi:MAG: hypothetical protein H3C31_12030 [Brumimicrobium sp.]|nr:hypothetical protein [Brumimicrobium sp.]MCO5267532.1 hypothetical protein [Brumimicrobium sp.]